MPDPDTMSMAADTFGMFESVVVAFFFLISMYFKSVMKQKDTEIENGKKELKEFKEVSKRDDEKVEAGLTKEMDRRIVNIEQLHAKVETSTEKLSKALERVAYMEGVHAGHKKP